MKKLLKILGYLYSLVLVGTIIIFAKGWEKYLLIPIIVYFVFGTRIKQKIKNGLWLYSLVLTAIITVANLLRIKTINQIGYALVFIPLLGYLISKIKISAPQKKEVKTIVIDESKRKFLRMAGSAGLMSIALFFLNQKKAQAAFFGSGGGTGGSISIKDVKGAKVDPATKQPLDGYSISNIDTSTNIHYYGFLNKDGDWYIIQENTDNNTLKYSKGDSGYATSNWLTWASSQSYDYFNAVFGD